jgi:site-specific DNA recombinase
LKAAIYCRVSTTDQNAENQRRMCEEYCKREGVDIYNEYIDSGYSGMLTNRPAFNQLLNDMRSYKFNGIVITKLDRVGRSLQHLLSLIEEFNKLGVNFAATTQGIDTHSATGKLQLQIMGAFAEYERALISERTIEGQVGKENIGKRGPDKKPRLKRGGIRKPLATFRKVSEME